jgi:hypothetical protein
MHHNQPRMKPKRYGKTLPLRISPKSKARIELLQQTTNLSASDITRMAIEFGLPRLEKGELPKLTGAAVN